MNTSLVKNIKDKAKSLKKDVDEIIGDVDWTTVLICFVIYLIFRSNKKDK